MAAQNVVVSDNCQQNCCQNVISSENNDEHRLKNVTEKPYRFMGTGAAGSAMNPNPMSTMHSASPSSSQPSVSLSKPKGSTKSLRLFRINPNRSLLQKSSTSNSSPLSPKTKVEDICKAWNEVINRGDAAAPTYIHALFLNTVRLTLSDQWPYVRQVERDALRQTLLRVNSRVCHSLASLFPEPWGGETVARFIRGSPPVYEGFRGGSDRQLHLCSLACSAEPKCIPRARVEILCYSGCQSEALRLCLYYRRCKVLSEDFFFSETALHLLYHAGDLKQMINSLQSLSCHEGCQLVEFILKKNEGAAAIDLAECLIQILLVRDIVGPSPYCCTLSLMQLWVQLRVQRGTEIHDIALEAQKLGALSITSAHIYLLVDVMYKEFGQVLFPLYIQLYVHALTIDTNYLDYARQIECNMATYELETHMSEIYTKLGSLLANQEEFVLARECILTAFSLEPTLDRLTRLQLWSKATSGPASMYVRPVPCAGECHCIEKGLCRGEPPSWYMYHVPNPILDSSVGISQQLKNDLVILIEGPRYRILSWSVPWDILKELCLQYLKEARDCVSNKDCRVGINSRLKRLSGIYPSLLASLRASELNQQSAAAARGNSEDVEMRADSASEMVRGQLAVVQQTWSTPAPLRTADSSLSCHQIIRERNVCYVEPNGSNNAEENESEIKATPVLTASAILAVRQDDIVVNSEELEVASVRATNPSLNEVRLQSLAITNMAPLSPTGAVIFSDETARAFTFSKNRNISKCRSSVTPVEKPAKILNEKTGELVSPRLLEGSDQFTFDNLSEGEGDDSINVPRESSQQAAVPLKIQPLIEEDGMMEVDYVYSSLTPPNETTTHSSGAATMESEAATTGMESSDDMFSGIYEKLKILEAATKEAVVSVNGQPKTVALVSSISSSAVNLERSPPQPSISSRVPKTIVMITSPVALRQVSASTSTTLKVSPVQCTESPQSSSNNTGNLTNNPNNRSFFQSHKNEIAMSLLGLGNSKHVHPGSTSVATCFSRHQPEHLPSVKPHLVSKHAELSPVLHKESLVAFAQISTKASLISDALSKEPTLPPDSTGSPQLFLSIQNKRTESEDQISYKEKGFRSDATPITKIIKSDTGQNKGSPSSQVNSSAAGLSLIASSSNSSKVLVAANTVTNEIPSRATIVSISSGPRNVSCLATNPVIASKSSKCSKKATPRTFFQTLAERIKRGEPESSEYNRPQSAKPKVTTVPKSKMSTLESLLAAKVPTKKPLNLEKLVAETLDLPYCDPSENSHNSGTTKNDTSTRKVETVRAVVSNRVKTVTVPTVLASQNVVSNVQKPAVRKKANILKKVVAVRPVAPASVPLSETGLQHNQRAISGLPQRSLIIAIPQGPSGQASSTVATLDSSSTAAAVAAIRPSLSGNHSTKGNIVMNPQNGIPGIQIELSQLGLQLQSAQNPASSSGNSDQVQHAVPIGKGLLAVSPGTVQVQQGLCQQQTVGTLTSAVNPVRYLVRTVPSQIKADGVVVRNPLGCASTIASQEQQQKTLLSNAVTLKSQRKVKSTYSSQPLRLVPNAAVVGSGQQSSPDFSNPEVVVPTTVSPTISLQAVTHNSAGNLCTIRGQSTTQTVTTSASSSSFDHQTPVTASSPVTCSTKSHVVQKSSSLLPESHVNSPCTTVVQQVKLTASVISTSPEVSSIVTAPFSGSTSSAVMTTTTTLPKKDADNSGSCAVLSQDRVVEGSAAASTEKPELTPSEIRTKYVIPGSGKTVNGNKRRVIVTTKKDCKWMSIRSAHGMMGYSKAGAEKMWIPGKVMDKKVFTGTSTPATFVGGGSGIISTITATPGLPVTTESVQAPSISTSVPLVKKCASPFILLGSKVSASNQITSPGMAKNPISVVQPDVTAMAAVPTTVKQTINTSIVSSPSPNVGGVSTVSSVEPAILVASDASVSSSAGMTNLTPLCNMAKKTFPDATQIFPTSTIITTATRKPLNRLMPHSSASNTTVSQPVISQPTTANITEKVVFASSPSSPIMITPVLIPVSQVTSLETTQQPAVQSASDTPESGSLKRSFSKASITDTGDISDCPVNAALMSAKFGTGPLVKKAKSKALQRPMELESSKDSSTIFIAETSVKSDEDSLETPVSVTDVAKILLTLRPVDESVSCAKDETGTSLHPGNENFTNLVNASLSHASGTVDDIAAAKKNEHMLNCNVPDEKQLSSKEANVQQNLVSSGGSAEAAENECTSLVDSSQKINTPCRDKGEDVEMVNVPEKTPTIPEIERTEESRETPDDALTTEQVSSAPLTIALPEVSKTQVAIKDVAVNEIIAPEIEVACEQKVSVEVEDTVEKCSKSQIPAPIQVNGAENEKEPHDTTFEDAEAKTAADIEISAVVQENIKSETTATSQTINTDNKAETQEAVMSVETVVPNEQQVEHSTKSAQEEETQVRERAPPLQLAVTGKIPLDSLCGDTDQESTDCLPVSRQIMTKVNSTSANSLQLTDEEGKSLLPSILKVKLPDMKISDSISHTLGDDCKQKSDKEVTRGIEKDSSSSSLKLTESESTVGKDSCVALQAAPNVSGISGIVPLPVQEDSEGGKKNGKVAKLKCSQCEKWLAGRYNLNRHLLQIHHKQKSPLQKLDCVKVNPVKLEHSNLLNKMLSQSSSSSSRSSTSSSLASVSSSAQNGAIPELPSSCSSPASGSCLSPSARQSPKMPVLQSFSMMTRTRARDDSSVLSPTSRACDSSGLDSQDEPEMPVLVPEVIIERTPEVRTPPLRRTVSLDSPKVDDKVTRGATTDSDKLLKRQDSMETFTENESLSDSPTTADSYRMTRGRAARSVAAAKKRGCPCCEPISSLSRTAKRCRSDERPKRTATRRQSSRHSGRVS